MVKNATVSARVEEDIKHEAEDILQQLGIPVSVVINTLYRQIIAHNGVPFALTLPGKPRTLEGMGQGELDAKLEHSCGQAAARRGRPYGEVFDEAERGLV